MKRLFGVKAHGFWICSGERPDVPMFFDSKMAAKWVRDEYNKMHSPGAAIVAPGPDHKRGTTK